MIFAACRRGLRRLWPGTHIRCGGLGWTSVGSQMPSVSADSAVPGPKRNLACMNKQLVPHRIAVDIFGGCATTIPRAATILVGNPAPYPHNGMRC